MEDKLKKASAEEAKTKKAYEDSLTSLSDVTPRYVEEMTQVGPFLNRHTQTHVLVVFFISNYWDLFKRPTIYLSPYFFPEGLQ